MKERLKRLLRSGSRISTQLHLAIWGAVALTICASLVAWLSLNRVGEVQSRVNEGSIPDIAASFEVAQYSGILVAAAPRLTTAATTEEFDEVALSINEAYSGFEEQLALLEEGTVGGESYARIRAHADTLIYNIEAIKEGTSESFTLTAGSEALGAELAKLRTQLDGIVVPAIDDQLFYVMTGYRNLLEPPAPRSEHFSEEELGHYRHLAQLVDGNIAMEQVDGNIAMELSKRLHPFSGVADRAATGTVRGCNKPHGAKPIRSWRIAAKRPSVAHLHRTAADGSWGGKRLRPAGPAADLG